MNANETPIIEAFEDLHDALEQFNTWWLANTLSCVAFSVPVLDERAAPDEIIVRELTGEEALNTAAQAFNQFRLLEDQAAGTSLRVPGCIVVGSNDLSPLHRVNKLKDELRSRIAQASPKGGAERARLCRRLFRSCSMNQIYRHIVTVENQSIDAVPFTWNSGAVSIRKLSQHEALALLQTRRDEEEKGGNIKLVEALDIASRTIAGLKTGAGVWKRKRVAPHPCANLVFERGGKGKGRRRLVKANLPIVLPESCATATIGRLKNFKMKDRRRTRGDKLNLVSVLDSMGLFVEVEAGK